MDDAYADSLWQIAMLAGALGESFEVELLSYEAPTYFGMICAAYSAALAGRRGRRAIGDDVDVLERDEPLGHHLVEEWEDPLDALGGVRDLDQDGQVLGQSQDPRCVQARIGAEALDAADRGRRRPVRQARTRSTIAWYRGLPCHTSDSPT